MNLAKLVHCIYPISFRLIVAAIVLSSQCSNRIASLIFVSSLEVLVTLMYISYSHLLSISLCVLTPACIHCNSTDSSVKLLVLLVDGMYFMDILKLLRQFVCAFM